MVTVDQSVTSVVREASGLCLNAPNAELCYIEVLISLMNVADDLI